MSDKIEKRGFVIIVAIVILIFAFCVTFILIKNGKTTNFVNITVDGELYEKINLSTESDRTFVIETEFGSNTVMIKDGKISIIAADCPDLKCVEMGELESDILPIVCLPHRLMISFVDE